MLNPMTLLMYPFFARYLKFRYLGQFSAKLEVIGQTVCHPNHTVQGDNQRKRLQSHPHHPQQFHDEKNELYRRASSQCRHDPYRIHIHDHNHIRIPHPLFFQIPSYNF